MSDISKEKIFISYIDESDKIVSGYVDLINISESLITIETDRNRISIPIHRLLKIKGNKWGDFDG